MFPDQPSFLIFSACSLEVELPGGIWAREWTMATYWHQDSKIHLGQPGWGGEHLWVTGAPTKKSSRLKNHGTLLDSF